MNPIALSHFDTCVLAARDLVLQNGVLRDWTGGNVVRVEGLAAPKGLARPHIAVAAAAFEPQAKTGTFVEVVLPIQFLFVWEAYRRVLDDSEPSILGVVSELMRFMHSSPNYYLKVPAFGMKRLTRRLQGWRAVAMDALSEPTESSVVLGLAIAGEYVLNVDSRTWEPKDQDA